MQLLNRLQGNFKREATENKIALSKMSHEAMLSSYKHGQLKWAKLSSPCENKASFLMPPRNSKTEITPHNEDIAM